MACNDPECSDDAAIREAIGRIAYEAHHLREDMAALKALGQARDRVNCPFMLVASSGLQSDLLARLARVLERDGRVGSFWFLHCRGVIQADRRRSSSCPTLRTVCSLSAIRYSRTSTKKYCMTLKSHIETDLHWLSEIEPAIAKISEWDIADWPRTWRERRPCFALANLYQVRRQLLPTGARCTL